MYHFEHPVVQVTDIFKGTFMTTATVLQEFCTTNRGKETLLIIYGTSAYSPDEGTKCLRIRVWLFCYQAISSVAIRWTSIIYHWVASRFISAGEEEEQGTGCRPRLPLFKINFFLTPMDSCRLNLILWLKLIVWFRKRSLTSKGVTELCKAFSVCC